MDRCGLYIHIPFCRSKCYYCDFPSYPKIEGQIPDYVEALKKEIQLIAQTYSVKKISSIFIGGGTPTYIHSTSILSIMETIKQSFLLDKNVEISIEGNPGTFDEKKMEQLRGAGINRLSIGLQAWQNKILKNLGRIHTNKDFLQAYQAAKNVGFQNINIDLMFGLPGQSLDDWKETIEKVLELNPTHLSCYSLKIEEGTPLYNWVQSGKLQIDEDLEREMYYYTKRKLYSYGYSHYEISNFSKPGLECSHNLLYWDLDPYIGAGASAHSFIDRTRSSNIDSVFEYINTVNNDKLPISTKKRVSRTELMEEFMFLGLRKVKGISKKDFLRFFGIDLFEIYGETLINLQSQDLITINENISLTDKGLDYANYVYQSFLL